MTTNLYYNIHEFTNTNLVKAGISLRNGGVSNAPYTSLNLATHVGDNPVSVIENQRRFSDKTGISSLKHCRQIHSDTVINADTVTPYSLGNESENNQVIVGDALISSNQGDTLGVFTADCVPIFILDIDTPAIGIAHAGWRGTIARIVQKTFAQMVECFGTTVEDCLVHLGPSIQECCYEVSSELLHRFEEQFGDDVHNGHSLSLQTANIKQLVDVGVPLDSISASPYCTACCTDIFYSYRAEGGETGRTLSYIQLTRV